MDVFRLLGYFGLAHMRGIENREVLSASLPPRTLPPERVPAAFLARAKAWVREWN